MIHQPAEAQGKVPKEVVTQAIETLNCPEDARCVQLCFHPRYHAGPHYNSVRYIGDSGDGTPPPASLVEVQGRMAEALMARRKQPPSGPGPASSSAAGAS